MPNAKIRYQVEIPGNSWKQNIPDDFASRSVFCGVVCPKKGMGSRYHETAEFLQDFSCNSATFVFNIEMTSEHPKWPYFLSV